MRDGPFNRLLAGLASKISGLARAVRDRVSALIRSRRKGTQVEIEHNELVAELRRFDEPYAEALAEAFAEVKGRPVSAKELRRLLVGEVSLSARLYHQAVATSARVRSILADHNRYAHDARKLALDLYEGYGFRETEVLVPRVRLPKYIDDAILNGKMDALLARVQAAQLKTKALRSAYLQALDRILEGAGLDAIDRALDVAVHERYRYFANRIAQTELARVQNRQVARELMAERDIEVVRIRLSAGHVTDLCDVFVKADRYGLGPGCYPKALAPLPVFHPMCRCTVQPLVATSAKGAREDPNAVRKYLATLDDRTAAQVAGSKAKRDEVLNGGDWESMLNRGRPDAYHIGRLGDVPDED